MCGNETARKVRASIEGVEMEVCPSCAKYGKVLPPKKKPAPELSPDEKKKIFEKVVRKRELLLLIADDYGQKVKQAREQLGFKQVELAKRMNERESLIHSIEQGKHEPSIELSRKLERHLGIKLVEEHVEDHKKRFRASNGDSFTLGDFIRRR